MFRRPARGTTRFSAHMDCVTVTQVLARESAVTQTAFPDSVKSSQKAT